MWIKVGRQIMALKGNASIRKDDLTIRLEAERSERIARYASPERTQEVFDGFWEALMRGDRCYEFPNY